VRISVADLGCFILDPDPDPRIEFVHLGYRIPDPTSYVKRGVTKVNILFLAAYNFRSKLSSPVS
jgi:hypothetical protein